MSVMDLCFIVLLFSSLCLVVYAYFGYPVLVWLFARLFGRERVRPDVEVYPEDAPGKRRAHYRSTSQRTMSSEPRIVTASAT